MIRITQNLLTILYACANSRLPCGIEWQPWLPLCNGDRTAYILCCGHVVLPRYAEKLIAAGIMKRGEPDRFGRPTITIADAGLEMLTANIHKMRT